MAITGCRSSRLFRGWTGVLAALLLVAAPGVTSARPAATATASAEPVAAVGGGGCTRPPPGSAIAEPPSLSGPGGSLSVSFSFQTSQDAAGRTLYCFVTRDGLQNPTLHVSPGGTLTVTVTNNTPAGTGSMTIDGACFAPQMDSSSVNIHYHGTNTSPACGGDQVIRTVINSGQTYTYKIQFPLDEPPGLYWYHPHIHGNSESHVMGGATGALIVDGIEKFFPVLEGMPQRTLVIRDQQQLGNLPGGPGNCGNGVPNRDVSANDIPVNSFQFSGNLVFFLAGGLTVPSGEQELWRVANTSADTILDLQVIYDGVPQTLNVVAIDGVPVNSQDGTGSATMIPTANFRLPPASRLEFVLAMPPAGTASAQMVTSNINTGAEGDCDPLRPLFGIATAGSPSDRAVARGRVLPVRPLPAEGGRRFAGVATAPISAQYTVYFQESPARDATEFYMTVDPQEPQVFSPNMPPGITLTQGQVQEWTVQNRTLENHEFHIHQIHFLVVSQNDFPPGHPVAPIVNNQYLDTIEVPAWSGNEADPFPSVTLLMDFTGDITGDFVFHCHILGHEDLGMMNIVRVLPSDGSPEPARATAAPAKPSVHTH